MTHLNFDCVEPVPYTVDEFARLAGIRRRDVVEMISRGELNCVTDGVRPRIPVSEMRRLVEEQLANAEGVRKGIALAILNGIVEEVGLDERGDMVFRGKRVES